MKNEKKWTTKKIPGQAGRTVIVTGANTGIGFETAIILVQKGAEVILACRDAEKANEAGERIQMPGLKGKPVIMTLDLSDLESIQVFADEFKGKYSALDLLINNAGVMMPPFSKTVQGFELQFGVNHLGHFALTGLLMNLLMKTRSSRIVTVSSMAHLLGKINFDSFNGTGKYNASREYGQSKLANVLFTKELQKRLELRHSTTISLASHPGWTQTDLQRHSGFFRFLNPFFGMKPRQGALPTLRAATDSEAEGGAFYGPDGWREMRGYPQAGCKTNPLALDRELAIKLWKKSEELSGVKYDI